MAEWLWRVTQANKLLFGEQVSHGATRGGSNPPPLIYLFFFLFPLCKINSSTSFYDQYI